jgi:hypothetical protein
MKLPAFGFLNQRSAAVRLKDALLLVQFDRDYRAVVSRGQPHGAFQAVTVAQVRRYRTVRNFDHVSSTAVLSFHMTDADSTRSPQVLLRPHCHPND